MNIKQIREKTGLSQSRFCEKFGLNKRTFMDWESGRKRPAEAARTLLQIIDKYPETVARVVWENRRIDKKPVLDKTDISQQSDVRRRLNKIFTEHLGILNIESYGPAADIWDDLGADSLDIVEMIMSVEDEFTITITESETEGVRKIGDIEQLVIKKTS